MDEGFTGFVPTDFVRLRVFIVGMEAAIYLVAAAGVGA